LATDGAIIVGGSNYGQGSSREHAAIAPLYLGVRAVLAKSFARIHMQNLVNFGLLPLILVKDEDYDQIRAGDRLALGQIREQLANGVLSVRNITRDTVYPVTHGLSKRQIEIVLAGGLLNYVKRQTPSV
jgi:aconitate hydratase